MSMRLAKKIGYLLLLAATLVLAQPQPIEDYTAAIKLRPEDPQPHVLRGNLYRTLGQLPAAIADWRQAIHLGLQTPAVYMSLGAAFAELGEQQKAVDAYSRAIKLRLD